MARRAISKGQLRSILDEIVRQATEEWESLCNEKPDASLKLYWRGPTRRIRYGRLKVAAEDPKRGWKLVCPMIMSRRWTREETAFFINERMVRLPFVQGPFKD